MNDLSQRGDIEIAESTLIGDLMSITLDTVKELQAPWPTLGEDDQDDVIERVELRVRQAVAQAAAIVATAGHARIPATLESATVKDGIKVVCTVAKHDAQRHQLLDACGSVVHLVLAADFEEQPHDHRADPDQRHLDLADDRSSGLASDSFGPSLRD